MAFPARDDEERLLVIGEARVKVMVCDMVDIVGQCVEGVAGGTKAKLSGEDCVEVTEPVVGDCLACRVRIRIKVPTDMNASSQGGLQARAHAPKGFIKGDGRGRANGCTEEQGQAMYVRQGVVIEGEELWSA